MTKEKARQPEEPAGSAYLDNASAARVNTNVVLMQTLRQQYPELRVVAVSTTTASLLSYAASGFAQATPIPVSDPALAAPLAHRRWISPSRRDDRSTGALVNQVLFGKFSYKWKKHEFIVYVAEGRDGTGAYPIPNFNYILGTNTHAIDTLIAECASWTVQLHNEIWVFDSGFWQKSADLWRGIQNSEWKDVILDEKMKAAIRYDITDFYNSKEQYQKYGVPWKRGLILHGPPGNGKTISIKATMHELLRRDDPIPTLYVRSLNSFQGPEFSVSQIFNMARRQAPCFLVFEDLDSIISPAVRSYFLNEVDGLKANDGILMVGSTNHLDQLDPGLSKRPSRFDRKYLFPDPNLEQRTQYAKYWQNKLAKSSEVEFPDKLCPAAASITDGFSFAYMQEAFVASLLALARGGSSDSEPSSEPNADETADGEESTQTDAAAEMSRIVASLREKKRVYEQLIAQLEKSQADPAAVTASAADLTLDDRGGDDDEPSLDELPLWRELKKQVAILREGIDDSGHLTGQAASAKIPALHGVAAGGVGGPMRIAGGTDAMGRPTLSSLNESALDAIRDRVIATGEEAWLDG